LLVIAVPIEGVNQTWIVLISAVAVAAFLDAVILRYWRGAWEYPSGAVLTGAIIAMVLSPHEPWYVAATGAAIGVFSKYVFRFRTANIFNPAALGLVSVSYVFGAGESWWGALPDAPFIALVTLVATGIFIANRVNKIPLVLAFGLVYFGAFTATAFAGDPRQVAEVYRAPDIQALLYFAFFILTDPPTSPVRYPAQIICGSIVALVSYAFFVLVGGADFLIVGALAGNVVVPWVRLSSSYKLLTTNSAAARSSTASPNDRNSVI
jgi:Na+-translocating ferredoxin:NAD+ oxidoreductase RnfD subunit